MATPKARLTDAEVEQLTSKLLQIVQLPEGEIVKDAFSCSMKGLKFKSKTSGKLYLTQTYLVFVGKKKFSQDFNCWHWYEIFDLSTNASDPAEAGKMNLVDSTKNPSIFSGFNGGQAETDRVCKVIRRVFFGVNENTVLHVAVEQKDHEKIKSVMEREIRLLAKVNRSGQTPLIMACVSNDTKLTRLLLDYYRIAQEKKIPEVDINQIVSGEHLLHVICRIETIADQILMDVLDFPGINVKIKNEDETTPLHYFCEKNFSWNCVEIGSNSCSQKFFDNGADPNAQTKYQETPLHKSIFNNKVRVMMMKMLLAHHANPDIRGSLKGDTPLHYAVRKSRKDLVDLLLSNGGDVTIQNTLGKDSLQVALESLQVLQGSEEAMRQAEEIFDLLRNVKDLTEMLRRAEIFDKLPFFIDAGICDPEILCETVNDKFYEKIGVKLGGKIKFSKEITELNKRMQIVREDKKKEKEARETERKQRSSATAFAASGKNTHGLDADLLRKQLGGQGWEIEFKDLEFCEPIGKGTSGSVFAGLYGDQQVAIKVLSTQNVEQELVEFQKEFEILRNLNSEYMIKFYGAVVEKYLMMVMELCEKGSLYDVLQKTPGEVNWLRATAFASDMAEGLAVLHSHDPPIIHRDMKSLNLLVTKEWRCKVCDFGLSRLQEGDLKTMGRLCGTFHFAGPEVFQGGVATDKFDVYSMGIVLWELLNTVATGKYEQPYAEYSFTIDFQVIVQTAQGLRPSIPVGAQLDFVDLFRNCVQGEMDLRPPALEVAQTIRGWRKTIQQDPQYFCSRLTDKRIDGRPTPQGSQQQQQQVVSEKVIDKKFTGWKK